MLNRCRVNGMDFCLSRIECLTLTSKKYWWAFVYWLRSYCTYFGQITLGIENGWRSVQNSLWFKKDNLRIVLIPAIT